MEIHKLKNIHPTIDRCVVSLWHSSRKTGDAWLDSTVSLFTENQRRKIMFLGPGTKHESNALFNRIEDDGFYKAASHLNQEWQVVTFLRVPEQEEES